MAGNTLDDTKIQSTPKSESCFSDLKLPSCARQGTPETTVSPDSTICHETASVQLHEGGEPAGVQTVEIAYKQDGRAEFDFEYNLEFPPLATRGATVKVTPTEQGVLLRMDASEAKGKYIEKPIQFSNRDDFSVKLGAFLDQGMKEFRRTFEVNGDRERYINVAHKIYSRLRLDECAAK